MAKTKHKPEDPEVLDETAEGGADETGADPTPSVGTEASDDPENTIERVPEPDEDEAEEDNDVAQIETDEDAADGPDDVAMVNGEVLDPTEVEAVEDAVEAFSGEDDDLPTPTLSTGDEYVAYLCGYRAGEDDPGWLLMLAEVGRHLGSFFTPEEEEVFLRLAAEDWWGRWALGYSDSVQKRAKRALARPTEAMDW